jgi:hypothetical protein
MVTLYLTNGMGTCITTIERKESYYGKVIGLLICVWYRIGYIRISCIQPTRLMHECSTVKSCSSGQKLAGGYARLGSAAPDGIASYPPYLELVGILIGLTYKSTHISITLRMLIN